MTLLLSHEDVKQCVDMNDAISAMERGFKEEGEGYTKLPQRINMKAGKGWIRVGPVALEQSGWMGFKAMNLAPGHGVRYQVHLYSIETGALFAIMDAQYLTTLRTGATSAVATKRLANPGPADIALLGSGPEAAAQLEAMRALDKIRTARIYSPTAANRERLAQHFRDLGIDAHAVSSAAAATDGASLILAAVKSSETVLHCATLTPGTHINSVGTARPDQREIDVETFTRANRIVVDTRDGVFNEAGDALAARDAIDIDQTTELASLVATNQGGREHPDEITLFKSVGTGLQDIALAAAIYQAAQAKGIGLDIGSFPYLKGR